MHLNAHRAQRGIIGLDVIAAIIVTGLVLSIFTVALQQFANARRDSDLRRVARTAAEAELERLRAVGVDESGESSILSAADANDVQFEIHAVAGDEPWHGLMLVRIVARKIGPGYRAEAELAGYVPIVATRPASGDAEAQP